MQLAGCVVVGAMLAAVSAHAQVPVKPATASAKGNVREVTMTSRSMEEIATREGFTTMLFIPDGDKIVNVVGGGGKTTDGEGLWSIDWADNTNMIAIRPVLEGLETNLHVTATSGITYSFMLRETKKAQPDIKVYVASNETPERVATRYYTGEEIAALKTELERALAATDEAQKQAALAVETFKKDYAGRVTPYAVAREETFAITAMWHDGEFTRVTTNARELPVIYEMKDGKPAEVNFQVQDGHTYLVPKILGSGYFKLGNKRLSFAPPVRGN